MWGGSEQCSETTSATSGRLSSVCGQNPEVAARSCSWRVNADEAPLCHPALQKCSPRLGPKSTAPIGRADRPEHAKLAEQGAVCIAKAHAAIPYVRRFGTRAVDFDDREILGAPECFEIGKANIKATKPEFRNIARDRVESPLERLCDMARTIAENRAAAMTTCKSEPDTLAVRYNLVKSRLMSRQVEMRELAGARIAADKLAKR